MNADDDLLLNRRILSQIEVMEILGAQVFRDALAMKWLKPCAVKRGKTAYRPAKVLYRAEDVAKVEERILAGEYPQPPPL